MRIVDQNEFPIDEKIEQPSTNYDRITAMNSEELEDYVRSIAIGYAPWCDHHCSMKGEDNCNICLRNWLDREAVE